MASLASAWQRRAVFFYIHPISYLTFMLTRRVDSPGLDLTGLAGIYDFSIDLSGLGFNGNPPLKERTVLQFSRRFKMTFHKAEGAKLSRRDPRDRLCRKNTEGELMAKGIPVGWHSITPRLVVDDPARLVEFLKQAFQGKGDFRTDSPSQIRIGDSLVMISGADARTPMPSFLYLYVEDVDAVYRRTLDAGAVSLEEPADLFYGDRRGMVRDPFGNIWQIATRKGQTE